ncbi:MAG: hypothetical protein Q9162_002392 [Coniocarpon cinnabarinum]
MHSPCIEHAVAKNRDHADVDVSLSTPRLFFETLDAPDPQSSISLWSQEQQYELKEEIKHDSKVDVKKEVEEDVKEEVKNQVKNELRDEHQNSSVSGVKVEDE